MKRSDSWRELIVGGGLLLIFSGGALCAQGPEKKQETKPAAKEETHQGETASVWMKRKLDLSRNLLGGIAAGDFDQISKNAHSLRTLSKLESFIRRGTPGYRTQVDFFEHSLDVIIRQADKENLEGVTLGFHQLTNSCVACHQQLREKK